MSLTKRCISYRFRKEGESYPDKVSFEVYNDKEPTLHYNVNRDSCDKTNYKEEIDQLIFELNMMKKEFETYLMKE